MRRRLLPEVSCGKITQDEEGRMPHLLPRSQPPGLEPELLQALLLALAQATHFEDVKLTVSLTNLIPQAFIKSIYCMLGFVPGAGDVKLMGTLPQGT